MIKSKNLLDSFKLEFGELAARKDLITLKISPLELWVTFSQLQLALRHPQNKGPSSEIALKVARKIQQEIALEGALAEVAEMGWNPDYDENFDEKQR